MNIWLSQELGMLLYLVGVAKDALKVESPAQKNIALLNLSVLYPSRKHERRLRTEFPECQRERLPYPLIYPGMFFHLGMKIAVS